jgi:hypothetical protein
MTAPASHRPFQAWLVVAALLGLPAFGIARTQPRLAQTVHDVKQRDDVYVLPPPSQLRAMALGYDAAAVDLLWAKLLVEYGTHWHEKRPFDATHYLDAILEIEPTYAPAYRFADTLIVYRPPRGTEEDARTARRYLERGIGARPGDHDVWLEYGQFIAFIGPSFLSSQDEKESWRRDGADAIAHAVELGASADRSLAAATMLSRAGARDASIKHLRRVYALTDDPQTRDEIAMKLQRLTQSAEEDEAERHVKLLESMWHRDYPFITRGEFLLVGPTIDPLRCAGLEAAGDPSCARTWSDALTAQPPPR